MKNVNTREKSPAFQSCLRKKEGFKKNNYLYIYIERA